MTISKNLSSLIVLLVMVFAPFFLHAQNAYSAKDLAAIQQKRKLGAKAEEKMDRKTLYHLGNFYLEIYNKYKDTSINAAIRSYKQSCFTEGDFMENEPFMAAFELGNIYEKGMGVEKDWDQALIYYFISDSLGEDRLSGLSARVCPADTILHTSPVYDSIAIAVNPFCGLKNTATIQEIQKIAAMAGYDRQVNIILYMPGDFYTSYFNYWRRNDAFKKIVEQIRSYMDDLPFDRINTEVRDGLLEQYTVAISLQ